MRAIALFLMATTWLFAADRRNIAEIGEKVDHATAKARGVTVDSFPGTVTFPQATGIISVLGNGTQYQINSTFWSIPAGTYVSGETINPNGEGVSTETYYFSEAVSGQTSMELWNGAFPASWVAGITRIRMFVTTGNKVTEVNAYVAVRSCCTNLTPQVTSITSSSNGSQLTITGQFSAAPMVGINGVPAQVISGVTAFSPTTGAMQSTVVIANPTSLDNGNGVATVCDESRCSQTNFNIPSPSPTNGKG